MANPTTIYRVQNDTGPDESFPITRAGAIIDLTGYTVKFGIKSATTDTVTNTAHQTCTLIAPTGRGPWSAKYRFAPGDLPDPGGDYQCDLKLIDPAGLAETLYEVVKIKTRAQIAV